MKLKILPAFAILTFSCCTLNAQIEKRNVLLGGSFGYGVWSNTGNNTSSNANVSPRISYAIGRNSVIGLAGNFSYGAIKYTSGDNKQITSNYGASLVWRRYIPIQNRLGWYAEVNGGVSGSTNEYKGTTNSKSHSINYSIGTLPGVYYQAMPKLLVNVNVGGVNFYRNIQKSGSGNPESRYSGFNVNFLNNFTFGVEFILGKKTES